MVSYDESVIIEFADRLYRRARTMVLSCMLIGFLFGIGSAGFAGSWYAKNHGVMPGPGAILIIGMVGAVLGCVVGRDRAFVLRLQAQTALCQAQIERNTRVTRMAEVGLALPPPIPMRR